MAARDRLAAMRTANGRANGWDEYDGHSSAPSYRVDPSAGINRRPPPGRGGAGQYDRPSDSLSSFEDEKYAYEPEDNGRRPRRDQNPFEPPIEMQAVGRPKQSNQPKGPREVSSTEEFFEAISNLQVDLKELQHLIHLIEDLSKRSLDTKSDEQRLEIHSESEQLSSDIKSCTAAMKQSIQGYEADHSLIRQRGDPDGNLQVRMDQLAALKKRFVETVQRYAEVEQSTRKAMKARVERQVRIVRPDATDQEIRAAVEDEINGGGAVFQQALVSSNRMGSARNALREVQSRAEDIKRIEQTITELATLFNDMATMVEEQDVQVQHIEKQAETVHQDVEAATVELKAAVVSAQGARKKRKCCAILIAVIILGVGGGIAIYILIKNGTIGGGAPPNNAVTTGNSTTTATRPASTSR